MAALIGGAAVLIALVALFVAIAVDPKMPSSKATDGDAIVACRDAVKDQLKAPSTAEFSGESVTWQGSRATVTGSVDAENSFGAQVRTDWTCQVSISGSGDITSGPTVKL